MTNPYRHPISTPVPQLQGVASIAAPAPATNSAGDAGEGDRYTAGYAQGQADAAQLHQWMQDKAWQDAVLMLVHYQTLAERTWLVGHEEAAAKLVEWWRHARALSETKSVEDIAATPAPAVDAVPAGELELRPMSVAPKDGSYILARYNNDYALDRDRHYNGRWFVIRHPGASPGEYDLGWNLFPGYGGVSDLAFNGWLPLPTVAAALSHGEGRK